MIVFFLFKILKYDLKTVYDNRLKFKYYNNIVGSMKKYKLGIFI